jgi:large subunit ribosomal protein L13
MSTHIPKPGEIQRQWFLIDAKDQVLGKLAVAAADLLAGKHKPIYTTFLDTGDHVIVVNAAQVHLTGNKEENKVYHRHTGYLGGLRSTAAIDVRKKNPARLVEEAVKGMLPKTKLGRAMFLKLKVYVGDQHPHQAQKPKAIAVKKTAKPSKRS